MTTRTPSGKALPGSVHKITRGLSRFFRRKNGTVPLVIAAAVIAALSPLMARAAERDLGEREEAAIRAATERVDPSVVRIQTIGGLETVEEMLQGGGPSTGLVVSADGYIVSSAYNFARRPSAILVSLKKRTNIPARLVATDSSRAVVLLKIDLTPADGELTVPEAAPLDSLLPGAWAIALGRTFDEQEPNVSVGIVSAVRRVWGKAVQTDAKISPANYGGPLVDVRGRVIGVLVPMSPMAGGEQAGAEWYDSGIGFAVPLSDIQKVLPELIKGRNLEAGLMGVGLKGRDLFASPPLVVSCQPGSPAYEAGVRAGDRIVAVNGREVANQAQLRHQVGPLYAGDTVRLAVERDKRRIEVSFKLVDKLPPHEHPFLGLLPIRGAADEPGVVVRFVYPGSPAEKAGLRGGDRLVELDGQKTKTAAAAQEVLNSLVPQQKVRLVVLRDTKRLELDATLARLPVEIPVRLPPARKPAGGRPPAAAADNVIDIKVPELKNECLAYIPPQSQAGAARGVLIWLAPPGRFDRKQMLAAWKGPCDAQDLILLAPQPRDKSRWAPDEVEFIGRALDQLAQSYELDPARIVIHGYQSSGAMALLLAFSRPGVVSGVSAVDAALPAVARPQPVQPASRLAVLLAHAARGPVAVALGLQLAQLRELKYPVTELTLDRPDRDLNDNEREALMRWIDTLDRL